jgi:hypothetical protein
MSLWTVPASEPSRVSARRRTRVITAMSSSAGDSALKSILPPGGGQRECRKRLSQLGRDGVVGWRWARSRSRSEAGTARPRRCWVRVTARYTTRSASATSGSDALPASQGVRVRSLTDAAGMNSRTASAWSLLTWWTVLSRGRVPTVAVGG